MRRITTLIVLTFGAYLVARGQSGVVQTQPVPATQPTADALRQAQTKLAATTRAVADANAICLSKVHASAEFKAGAADRDAKHAALEAARQGDSIQARLDAGSAYNLAREKLNRMEADAIQADGPSQSALAAMKLAQENFSIAKRADDAKQQEAAALLAATSPPAINQHPYRDRVAAQSGNHQNEAWWVKLEYTNADRKDRVLAAYRAKHPDLPSKIIDAAVDSKVIPGMPVELLDCVAAEKPYTVTETSEYKLLRILLWEPFGLASNLDMVEVYVTNGSVEQVTHVDAPTSPTGMEPYDPRMMR